jgi:endonuclease YncB( thermonuclease family)
MSISFAQWRRAERLKFDPGLRVPKRNVRGHHWRRLRLWSRNLALLGLAACTGVAIGFALDLLDHGRSEPNQAQAASVVILRPASATTTATVIDGDTLKLGNERIRLHGIDAPESKQRCTDGWQAGEAARHALAGLVSAGTPSCEKVTTDRYGRTVAVCRVNGKDIGGEMVKRGLAWAYTRYSVRYVPEEARARVERVGVHARTCTLPADWRAQNRR